MFDEVTTTLFNYAYDQNISVMAKSKIPEDWIPIAIPSRRLIIINMNWYQPREIPLQIAHETAHVLNGGTDYAAYSRCDTNPEEAAANQKAVQILMNLFLDDWMDIEDFNPVNFMETYRIPERYFNLVKNTALKILA